MLPASDNPRKAILLAYSVQKPKVTVEFLKCDEPKVRCAVIHKNHGVRCHMKREGKMP